MMSQCLICSAPLVEFLDLGKQPSANAFLTKEAIESLCPKPSQIIAYVGQIPVFDKILAPEVYEYFYDLKLCFCDNCKIVQTLERPSKEMMFNENYAYFTSVNQPMVQHFKNAALDIKENHIWEGNKKDFFIVEIGSNDGVFLQNFVDYKHLGIEPSINVLDEAMKKNVECWGTFFNKDVALDIISKKGKANVIYAANVFGHTENIKDIMVGIKELLSDDGTFIFEIYYLPKLLEQRSFDLIYDEHIFYYTLIGLKNLFAMFDMQLFDVDEIDVHGGSIRGHVCHKKPIPGNQYFPRCPSQKLGEMLQTERRAGFETMSPLYDFKFDVEEIKNDFVTLLRKLKGEGKTIAGYGATAKSTTVLNYCCKNENLIDFIVDSTPAKQGKFTPGSHIPIYPEQTFFKNPPDYTVLFAWNYAKQIMNKQKWYAENGGKWILLHPKVRIV